MVINISHVWQNVAQVHTDYLNKKIDDFLDDYYFYWPQPHCKALSEVARFVLQYREVIADPFRTDYTRILRAYEKRFPDKSDAREDATPFFKHVFDYKHFSDKYSTEWNAYDLCAEAKWTVCPYCHIHGTETVEDTGNEDEYRPPLDHYHPKSTYPFLALSLGNLVPACAQCNGSGFKHAQNFYLKPHLHPLSDSENIGFSLGIRDPAKVADPIIASMRGDLKDYVLQVFVQSPCTKSSSSLTTFKLPGRYAPYLGSAKRIATHVLDLATHINAAVSESGADASRESMARLKLGFDVDFKKCLDFDHQQPHAYKNCPTGKMQLDVYHAALRKCFG